MSVASRRSISRAFLALSLAGILGWGALRLHLAAANVHASWSYDYAPEPACSAEHRVSCIDHFEVLDITTAKFALLASVPNPAPAVGKIDGVSANFKYGPPFGERVIAVVAVGKDGKGTRVTSNPYAARAAVLIHPKATVSAILK